MRVPGLPTNYRNQNTRRPFSVLATFTLVMTIIRIFNWRMYSRVVREWSEEVGINN